jgi:hypothetical protein
MRESEMNDSTLAAMRGHDAEIVSIEIDRNACLCRIGLAHEDGRRSRCEMIGVIAFRVEDLGLQNVVSRIVMRLEDFSKDALTRHLEWVTSLSDAHSWLKPQRKDEWLLALHEGRLEIVVFEPSAGAQIVIVCSGAVQVFL